MVDVKNKVLEKTATKLMLFQKRCVNCGNTFMNEVHHRIFRSEGDEVLKNFLSAKAVIYKKCYERDLELWNSIHDIQNLCVLCASCHTALHNGDEDLRQKIRNEFTCKTTGFCVPYYKSKTLY